MTEDEMFGWLDVHEFERALGVGDGLVCCSPWILRVEHTE